MHELVAGVDEAGRGPLAGPVVAAAVILDPASSPEGLTDSKKLSPARRERLYEVICREALSWSVAEVSVAEIDRINILQASLLAMQKAVAGLTMAPVRALVDGDHAPQLNCAVETIIKGDLSEPAISAASILAKVHRDRLMCALDAQYPGYGLAGHKGYPTKAHIEALHRLGVTPIHRTSYAPVRRVLEQEGELS